MIKKTKLLQILDILQQKGHPRDAMYAYIAWHEGETSIVYDILYKGIEHTIHEARLRKLQKQQKGAMRYSTEEEFTEEELDQLLATI